MNKQTNKRITWTSQWSFMIAAVSASVGLGNIWKFPYEMGLNGGASFLYIYIPCLFLIAFPVMVAEVMLGRYGKSNPVRAMSRIVKSEGSSPLWKSIGYLAMLTGFMIFSYYSVVASWILFYLMESLSASLVGIPAEIVQNKFTGLLLNTTQILLWHCVFVLMVILILSKGLVQGIERVLMVFMPCLILLIGLLCAYAIQVGDFERAYDFMFSLESPKFSFSVIVSAITHAFFTLSIGMGVLMIYGSYMRNERSIFMLASTILVFDTVVALLMGVVIFSIVFAFDLRPDSGVGLIFQTLPVAFAKMDNSIWWSTAFFLLLLISALSSAFALLEPMVAYLVEEFGFKRRSAAWLVGSIAWVAGLLSVFSFSKLQFNFYYFDSEKTNGLFDFINILSTNVLMPLTALLIVIYSGWKVARINSQRELAIHFDLGYKLWRFTCKIIVPVVIILLLVIVLFNPY